MPDEDSNPDVPFQDGDWLIDSQNPGDPGQFTGRVQRMTRGRVLLQLRFPSGRLAFRPMDVLSSQPGTDENNPWEHPEKFGDLGDLQRLVTFEKLRGTLNEVIYSMEAAQIDFYPYQFKPVLKFINSPTERLIIADEVGLGKTIEAALIWMELQARRQARRLLVVCPPILQAKWREELRSKFQLDARLVDFRDLQQEMAELKTNGPAHPFVAITSYERLRSPKPELAQLDEEPESDDEGSPKTRFLRQLNHWKKNLSYDAFDLVIFDEAHYMRNPATTTYRLGECLAASAGAVLCVSATPINNRNADLHTLLRLIDEDFFESQGMFEDLLEANLPAVKTIRALSRSTIDQELLREGVQGMGESPYVRESPLFEQLLELLDELDESDKSQVTRAQDLAEKLNLMGGYINRTRRVQVAENRPVRVPVTLTVTYTDEEMKLYRAILDIVQRRCRQDNRPFHVFKVMGIQLRAASCLPVFAAEMKSGRYGELSDLYAESLGGFSWDTDEFDVQEEIDDFEQEQEMRKLLDHDFEAFDTKYQKLVESLQKGDLKEEKAVIFAYYRATLAYLRRRLIADGINVTVIHGGVDQEQRWEELERFKDPNGPRVLLSSEVGSEGIDLQFCRVVVNYDLPWNPMRVEQRIGRIDRVGQTADKLNVVNFKVSGTIEERLFDRLHSKMLLFANALGDLESTIGEEVKNLTIELLSNSLTEEQQNQRVEHTEQVLEKRILQIEELEKDGDALMALSDYVQKKVTEGRDLGRYIQAEELEDYLVDFFENHFKGSEVNQNTPSDRCLTLRLSPEAQTSLSDFIKNDHSLIARPLRQREFSITFHRDMLERLPVGKRKRIHFMNHISPLIRWCTEITKQREADFYPISALELKKTNLPVGEYAYLVQRWRMDGLVPRENLAYGIVSLEDGKLLPAEQAEGIFNSLLRNGSSWDYAAVEPETWSTAKGNLEDKLSARLNKSYDGFEAENENAEQVKKQRVANFFDRRIATDKKALATLVMKGRSDRVIKATEARLANAQNNKKRRLSELQGGAKTDLTYNDVAAGIFRVVEGEENA